MYLVDLNAREEFQQQGALFDISVTQHFESKRQHSALTGAQTRTTKWQRHLNEDRGGSETGHVSQKP